MNHWQSLLTKPTGNLDFSSRSNSDETVTEAQPRARQNCYYGPHDLMYLKYTKSIIQIADGQLDKIVGAEGVKKIIKQIQAQATSHSK